MKFRDLSIRNKLIVIILASSFTCVAIVLALLFLTEIHQYNTKLISDTKLNAKLIGDYCAAPLDFGYAMEVDEILQKVENVPYISHAYVYDTTGQLIASYDKFNVSLLAEEMITDKITVRQGGHIHSYQDITLVNDITGSIYLASDASYKYIINELLIISILAYFGMLGVSYLLALYLQRKISGPILILEKATLDVSESNDYSVRVSKVSNDEVGSLFDGFNMMLEQISEKESERNHALVRLQESEVTLKDAQRIANMGSWTWNLKTNKIEWSDNMCLIHGIKPHTFDGKFETVESFLHPDDKESVVSQIQKMLETKEEMKFIYRIVTRDGKAKFVQGHQKLTLDSEGDVVYLNGTLQDVTSQKEAEVALRESESKFRSVIEQSNDAIYILRDDNFDLINQRFTELTGITVEDIADPEFNFLETLPSSSRAVIEDRGEIKERGEQPSGVFEFEIVHKNGKRFEVQASVSEIDYRNGKATLGLLRDMTERKYLEDQLRQAQKIESIGHLAGGIAHDFNNLLTPIIANTELAMMDMEPSSPLYEDLHDINDTALRASELTRQLLAFSRKQVLDVKTVSLNRLIENFRKILRRTIREDVKITMKYGDFIENIRVDVSQIEQILMNLFVNAQDAMPTGGVITIKTDSVVLDNDYAENHPDVFPGRYVLLSISDTGEGIPNKLIQNIFDPFFTTKEVGKGTGLGLSTVYGIVKQHDGNISVDSELGKGTTFNLYFPIVDAESTPLTKPSQNANQNHGTGTIMIVEDEDNVRQIASRILKGCGYTIYEASGGSEAITMIKDQNLSLDLLLTDVIMPNMNGRELFKQLSGPYPELKVLYMSGYTQQVVSSHGILEKGIEIIFKPLTVDGLANKVKDILSRAGN
jgi:PAS domain S-box-containing protein